VVTILAAGRTMGERHPPLISGKKKKKEKKSSEFKMKEIYQILEINLQLFL
jgi:hypothetical protein